MKTTKLDHDACPYCGYLLDAVTAGPENPEAVPEPDDFTVCIKCAGVLVFAEGLKVRRPSEQELAEALANPEMVKIVQAISDLQRRETHDRPS